MINFIRSVLSVVIALLVLLIQFIFKGFMLALSLYVGYRILILLF